MNNIFCELFPVVHNLESYQVLAQKTDDEENPAIKIITEIDGVTLAATLGYGVDQADKRDQIFDEIDLEKAQQHFSDVFKMYNEAK